MNGWFSSSREEFLCFSSFGNIFFFASSRVRHLTCRNKQTKKTKAAKQKKYRKSLSDQHYHSVSKAYLFNNGRANRIEQKIFAEMNQNRQKKVFWTKHCVRLPFSMPKKSTESRENKVFFFVVFSFGRYVHASQRKSKVEEACGAISFWVETDCHHYYQLDVPSLFRSTDVCHIRKRNQFMWVTRQQRTSRHSRFWAFETRKGEWIFFVLCLLVFSTSISS